MNESDTEPCFYCDEHKPLTPSGWLNVPNLHLDKHCQHRGCQRLADRELAPKPLAYPKLYTA